MKKFVEFWQKTISLIDSTSHNDEDLLTKLNELTEKYVHKDIGVEISRSSNWIEVFFCANHDYCLINTIKELLLYIYQILINRLNLV